MRRKEFISFLGSAATCLPAASAAAIISEPNSARTLGNLETLTALHPEPPVVCVSCADDVIQ
jgi:hypothetical protein